MILTRNRRTTALRPYVAAVTLAGVATLAYFAIADGHSVLRHADLELAILVTCAVVADLVPVTVVLRGTEGEITTATTFAFALVIAAGPAAAALGLAVASAFSDVARRKSPMKIGFNVAQSTLTVAAAGLVLGLLSDVPRAYGHDQFMPGDLFAILAAAVVFYVVNTCLVAAVIALAEGIGIWAYLARDFFFQASTGGLLLGLSPMLVLGADFSLATLPLLVLPLVAVHRGGRQTILKEHQALHDALTQLPNRVLFRDRVEQAVRLVEREGGSAVVMIMDLDRFKDVNDTLGHHQGDRLLQEVASRLQSTIRSSDTVARLGGDEFGILLPTTPNPAFAGRVAEKLLTSIRRPFEIDGLTFEIDASVGIASFPADGADFETLIQRGDIAMYVAKDAQTGFESYTPDRDRHSPARLTLATELRHALQRGEVIVAFQPKAELESGRIVGAEALVRWQHPERGLLSPDQFIPIAEHTGVITQLTRYVLNDALRQSRAWQDAGLGLNVAVNLSPRSFLDGQLAVEIPRLLEEWRIDSGALELEITETMIMTDPVRAKSMLDRLSQIGLTLSIDDFGTGYSSLANLQRLPVNEIKIDKSFILEMSGDKSAAAIVRSTIELAHNLGLRVIAEGVEDEEVWDELARLRCDLAQGFFLSPAVPAAELTQLIASSHAASFNGALDGVTRLESLVAAPALLRAH
jgi:diguanylate cyclase (GGDEF)-like protein